MKKCVLQKSKLENPRPSPGVYGQWTFFLTSQCKRRVRMLKKWKWEHCDNVHSFVYLCKHTHRTRMCHIFSLPSNLKLCNFVSLCVEKNLLQRILCRIFLWYLKKKMHCFGEKNKILDFGASFSSDLMKHKEYGLSVFFV